MRDSVGCGTTTFIDKDTVQVCSVLTSVSDRHRTDFCIAVVFCTNDVSAFCCGSPGKTSIHSINVVNFLPGKAGLASKISVLSVDGKCGNSKVRVHRLIS